MKAFKDTLKELNDQMDLPQPIKSRILLEIYADLVSAYEQFCREGMEEAAAIDRARDTFGMSGDNLGLLSEIHRPGLRKFIDRLTVYYQIPMEKPVIITLFSLIAIFIRQIMMGGRFMNNASVFVYPVLILFLISFVVSGLKFYQLYIRQDHNPRLLREGLNLITGLIGLLILLISSSIWFFLRWRIKNLTLRQQYTHRPASPTGRRLYL